MASGAQRAFPDRLPATAAILIEKCLFDRMKNCGLAGRQGMRLDCAGQFAEKTAGKLVCLSRKSEMLAVSSKLRTAYL